MHRIVIEPSLVRKLRKLRARDRRQWQAVLAKALEIAQDPHRYKNLRRPLQDLKRVHILGSFVLLFEVDDGERTVTLITYEHHDHAYNWK